MRIVSFDSGAAVAERVVDFKTRLAKEDPRLIPPTRRTEASYYAAEHPFLRHGRVKHFVVESGAGKVLGAVSAAIDDQQPGDVGLVGLYQSVNDQAVANLLLGAARAHLAAAGKRVMKVIMK